MELNTLNTKLSTLLKLRKNSESTQEYNRLSVAICRLKKKIDNASAPDANPALASLKKHKENKTLSSSKLVEPKIKNPSKKLKVKNPSKKLKVKNPSKIKEFSLVPFKAKPKIENLEFLMQWELAPVLCDSKCSHYIPSQVEDLHAFILENYILSDKTSSGIPFYVLAAQFLMYLVERDNCNVRVKGLRNMPGIKNPAVLEERVIFALNNPGGWRDILQLTNKNIGSNQEVNKVDEDSSLANIYFAPISNPTNCLSIDGLGNFGELFRARIEWISKSSCSKMVTKSLICQSGQVYDQISVVENLQLKKDAWLANHRYLLDWSLPSHYGHDFKPNVAKNGTLIIV